MRAPVARADSAAFCRRLPRQPAKPGDGKLAEEPSAEEPRAEGEARGPLCGALPEGSTQIQARGKDGAADGGGGGGGAPPTVPPPHTASGSLTHTRWEGRGLAGGRGRREGTGQSHSGRRCRGAVWSLGSCSSPTEEKRDTLLTRPSCAALRMLGGRGSPSTVTMVTDTLRKRTCLGPLTKQGLSCIKVLLGIPPLASPSYFAPPPTPSLTTHKYPVKSDISIFRSSLLFNFIPQVLNHKYPFPSLPSSENFQL